MTREIDRPEGPAARSPDGPIGRRGVVVVVGNPRTASRTRAVAELVAARVDGLVRVDTDDEPPVDVIELGPWATALVGDDDRAIEALRSRVLGARALVIASPTYKASFTGLLKLFLERFAANELDAKPTVAVMTGGTAEHSLVVSVHLTPVLVHLGASLPAAGIHLTGTDVDEPDAAIDRWFDTWRPVLRRAIA